MAKKSKLTTDEKSLATAPAVAGTPEGLLARHLLHLLLLALVAVVAYANTFHAPFVFDDNSSIVDNPVVKDLSAFLSGGGYAYNPRRFIGYLSFALNYTLGGLDATGYHIFNLVVHIITAWLVYSLVRLTFKTPYFAGARNEVRGKSISGFSNLEPRTSNLVPLLAALLFVAHPVQTQAVTYIVQRLASLATLFYLASLVFYIKARLFSETSGSGIRDQGSGKDAKDRSVPGPRSLVPVAWFILSLVSAILAMRTKEIAATLPVVVLLYEFSFFGAGARKRLIVLIPLLLTILIVPLGMLQAGKPLGEILSDVSEMARESQTISRGDYLLTQFSVVVTYIRLLILPISQNLDYDYPVYHSLFTPRVFLSFLLLCAILAGAIWLYYRSGSRERGSRNEVRGSENLDFPSRLDPRTSRLISFGIFWFFITLSVESSVIPISDVIFEHRLYLPSVGAFIAMAAGASLLLRRYSPRTFGTVIIIVAILAAATWHRNSVWGDDLTLWRDTAAKSPNKYRPHNNLGNALLAKGNIDEAIAEFRTSLNLKPEDAEAHANLGVANLKKGWTDQAIKEFTMAVRLNPGYAPAHNNLGEAYNSKGLTNRAIESYQAAVKLKSDFAEARNNLGAAYLKKGWPDRAIEEYQAALKIKPNEGNFHFNLGVAYEHKGWPDKALEEYRLAIMLQPEDREARNRLESLAGKGGARSERAPSPADASADTAAAHFRKANSLTDNGLVDEAIREYEATLRLKPDFADVHNNLGVAYGMKGNPDKAIKHLEAAIRLKPDDPDAHLNMARAYEMKGLPSRAEEERRLADKLGKRGSERR